MAKPNHEHAVLKSCNPNGLQIIGICHGQILMQEDDTMVSLGNSWDELLKDEFAKEYYQRIRAFLKAEYANPAFPVYPDMHDIFNALKITDYHAVKAVILGQDPYHGPSQAHGLCFSVQKGV